jgi:hypothetical protein
MTGTWHHRVTGDRFDSCVDVIEQSGVDLSTEITCEVYGSGTTSGSIDLETGQFFLNGTVGGYAMQSEGTLSLDGSAIGGRWSVTDPAIGGTFVGLLQQPPTPTAEPSDTPQPTETALSAAETPLPTATPGGPALPDTGSADGDEAPTVWIVASIALLGVAGATSLAFALSRRMPS